MLQRPEMIECGIVSWDYILRFVDKQGEGSPHRRALTAPGHYL